MTQIVLLSIALLPEEVMDPDPALLVTTAGGGGHSTTTINNNQAAPSAAPAPSTPPPVVVTVPVPASPAPTPSAPNVSSPWAVTSAYYADVESGDYADAWALMDNGNTLPGTYQEFVAGYATTGAQTLTENWESGDQVGFSLAAVQTDTGQTNYYTGTYTVGNGVITNAQMTQTG